jgi:hypothetical protein
MSIYKDTICYKALLQVIYIHFGNEQETQIGFHIFFFFSIQSRTFFADNNLSRFYYQCTNSFYLFIIPIFYRSVLVPVSIRAFY